MLGVRKKNTSRFSQVMGVYSVFAGLHGHSALQSFKCVRGGCGHTLCAYTKLTFCLHHLGTAVLSSLHSGEVVLL